ncbi:MAG: GlsB/YeaQ/YmgE family stress response membrane protein [Candidatus Dormibacteraceae bacterium]
MTASLHPFSWLLIGLLAGAISGRLVRGRGYGCCLDIVVGSIGGFIGGLVVSHFLPGTTYGFLGSLVVAILGSMALLIVLRLIIPGNR